MSHKTLLDGIGLLIANLGGGFAITAFVFFLSPLVGGGNLGFGIYWIINLPFFVCILAAFLWALQAILIWTWRSRSDKRLLALGFFGSFFVLLASYLLNIWLQNLWESSLWLAIWGVMLLWSCVLAAMRMQLWLDYEMIEKAKREDSF